MKLELFEPLTTLNLQTPPGIKMQAGGMSTLAAPSAELVQALLGMPAAAGKPVTRATAMRVVVVVGVVKMLAGDIAKMPLVMRETKLVDGRQRTGPAIDDPFVCAIRALSERSADLLPDALFPCEPAAHEWQLLLSEDCESGRNDHWVDPFECLGDVGEVGFQSSPVLV